MKIPVSVVRFRLRAPIQLPVKSSQVKKVLSKSSKINTIYYFYVWFRLLQSRCSEGHNFGAFTVRLQGLPLIMKLNARQIETAKSKEKTYKLSDGGGALFRGLVTRFKILADEVLPPDR